MSLFKHALIQQHEDDAVGELLIAFETSRKRHLVDEDDEDLVVSGDGASLSAVNSDARLCWAHFLCREMAGLLSYDDVFRSINQPVFLVTLVDIGCARASNEFNVDLKPMVRRLGKGLHDCNYIGLIEPGLYPYIATVGASLDRSQCVSWHLHALVWGIDAKRLKRLVAKLNRTKKYIPISPDQTGVDARRVRDGEFAETLAYLLKRPTMAYRLAKGEKPNSSGEIKFHQYEGNMRPGERLTSYLQMRHLSLPDLWIASGDGKKVLKATIRQCRMAIRRFERASTGKQSRFGRRGGLFDLVNDQ
ncbi:hypothetical protein [Bradyrhizobium sp. USDA 336]|uniref:hypothetical protein n=1 Tax=Bradyrhizobium sp. USDA 336 TaxID=3156311 RepID=UPI003834A06A